MYPRKQIYGLMLHCRYTRSGEEHRFTASLEIDPRTTEEADQRNELVHTRFHPHNIQNSPRDLILLLSANNRAWAPSVRAACAFACFACLVTTLPVSRRPRDITLQLQQNTSRLCVLHSTAMGFRQPASPNIGVSLAYRLQICDC